MFCFRFCGSLTPNGPVVSRSNRVTIFYNSFDQVATDVVFKATITFHDKNSTPKSLDNGVECGGTLTEAEGSFTSPGYPSQYPLYSDCEWTITAPPRYLLLLAYLKLTIDISNLVGELQESNSFQYILYVFSFVKIRPEIYFRCKFQGEF